MVRQRFPLTSDQLELLLAFEVSDGLQALAAAMAKDPSVVSRNLQQLAETSPVIVKSKGKWQMSPLGSQINVLTKGFLQECEKLVLVKKEKPIDSKIDVKKAPLIIINAQMGLLNPTFGNRSNSEAELNIGKLLEYWRANNGPVIHVRHSSSNSQSAFYYKSKGFEFMQGLAPQGSELIIEKTKSSAFTDTVLADRLNHMGADSVVIVGFTANECIDATARHAAEMGMKTIVVGDASASFDVSGHDGKLYPAYRVHKLVLANLHALYAEVIETSKIIG